METINPYTLWESVLTELQLSLSGANYQTWFKGKTQILSVKNGVVEIACSSAYNKTWIEERYTGQIKSIVDRITEKSNTLAFIVTNEPFKVSVSKKRVQENTSVPLFVDENSENLKKVFQSSSINSNFSFSNFLVGDSNQLAFAVAKAVADSEEKYYNPLLLHGGVGVGKTHLLQAIGYAVCVRKPNAKVLYASSETFTNDMVDAIQRRQTLGFRDKYRNLDLLLLDDIQFLAGRESTQEQFFHTFNELYRRGSQIVLTCDRRPEEIDDLQDRLKNRFVGGMLAKIENPNLELREAILLSKSQAAGLPIDFTLISYLAKSLGPSIRELEGALLRLEAVSKLTGNKISENLIDEVIGKQKKSRVDSNFLVEKVADEFSILPVDIRQKSRRQEAVLARQISMYFMRTRLNMSYGQIGRFFGGKDHSTAIYSVQKVENLVEKNGEIQRLVEKIRLRVFDS